MYSPNFMQLFLYLKVVLKCDRNTCFITKRHVNFSFFHSCFKASSSPPQQGFPVIFHGVLGKDEREANSPSFFNVSEIEVLVMYLNKLHQTQGKKGLPKISAEDIGIIAPYRKQVRLHIHMIFFKGFVGSDIINIHLQQVEKIRKALRSIRTLSQWTNLKELKVGMA